MRPFVFYKNNETCDDMIVLLFFFEKIEIIGLCTYIPSDRSGSDCVT